MNKYIIFIVMFASINVLAAEQSIKWGNVASINSVLLQKKAKDYLFNKKPELKNIAIKFIQMDAKYHKNHGSSLEIVFLHTNSFKPIEKSYLYNSLKGESDPKYCMEFIVIEFSQEGEPIKVRLNDVLLGKEKSASEKTFWDTYNSF